MAKKPHPKGAVTDPFHRGGGKITRQQLKVLQARHDARVQKGSQQQDQGNDPAAVTAPLTPNTLAAETAAAQRLKYGPAEANLTTQVQNSDAQQGRISDWFKQYLDQVAYAKQANEQAYANAQNQVNAQNQSLNQSDQAQRDQINQQNAQQSQVTGVQANPGVEAQAQQASTYRQAMNNSFGAQLSAQGAAQSVRGADQQRIGSLQGLQAHVTESARRAQLLGQLQQTEADKGDFGTQYAATARENERKYLLEQAAFGLNQQKEADTNANAQANTQQHADAAKANAAAKNKALAQQAKALRQKGAISQRAYDLQVKKLQAATRQNRIGNAIKQENANTSARKGDIAQQRADQAANKGGGSGGLTPTQQRAQSQKFEQAQAYAQTVATNGIKTANGSRPATAADGQAIVRAVVLKYGIPRVLATIAAREALGLQVGPSLQAAARRHGVRVSRTSAPTRPAHGT